MYIVHVDEMPTQDIEKGGVTMTDSRQLEKKIKDAGVTKKWLASQLGLTYFGLQKKINGTNEFKACEIKDICKILHITSLKQRDEIFFAGSVDDMPTKVKRVKR